ncbi:MAG: hypothetical protein NTY14_08475 [Candidatus Omnitrophica bacterium]|nr:hypothetical protein [Candidatus Omnitrophota bacterium]
MQQKLLQIGFVRVRMILMKKGGVMAQYWFKPKCCGWGIGWPVSWQGWISLLFLFIFVGLAAFVDGIFERTAKAVMIKENFRFLLDVIILASLFCVVVQDKIEGGLKWRWSKR